VNAAALALAARIVLAIVLFVSATAKFRTRDELRRQVGTLVSERAAPVIAALLPLAELAVGWSLVAFWNAVPGAVAVVLLAAFTVVLVRAQARHIPCLCFGVATSQAPAGPAAIVRNGVLMALAVLSIGSPSGAAPGTTLVAGAVFGVVAALAVRASR
jgi:Methylamine utilisation protein MauE